MAEKLSVGRRLHYIIGGECRPADVTKVWEDGIRVNVTVILDDSDAYYESNYLTRSLHLRKSGLQISDTHQNETMHWPEKV